MSPTGIYMPAEVEALRAIYRPAIQTLQQPTSVHDFLNRLAGLLWQTVQDGKEAAATEFSNWHPAVLGRASDLLFTNDWSVEDCRLVAARSHGFQDWQDVEASGAQVDPVFEEAVDHLLEGRKLPLEKILDQHPDLVSRASAFGHRARLIHYVGSNGVETWRQIVPFNLPDMLRLLLDRGADPRAPHLIYQGQGDLRALIQSSAHPATAGVQVELLDLIAY